MISDETSTPDITMLSQSGISDYSTVALRFLLQMMIVMIVIS